MDLGEGSGKTSPFTRFTAFSFFGKQSPFETWYFMSGGTVGQGVDNRRHGEKSRLIVATNGWKWGAKSLIEHYRKICDSAQERWGVSPCLAGYEKKRTC